MRRSFYALATVAIVLTASPAAADGPAPRKPPAPPPPVAEFRPTVERLSQTAPAPVADPVGPTRFDFDGDGRDEIVVSGMAANGTVVVSYSKLGARDVITAEHAYSGMVGFGFCLTGGDFNADGYDDLVVGDIGEGLATAYTPRKNPLPPVPPTNVRYGVGGVWVIPGSSTGLRVDQALHVHRDLPGVPGDRRTDDWFGASVAAGDLNRDGYADLVAGAPGDDGFRGSVSVFYGGATGLTATGSQLISQETVGVPDIGEESDQFGSALAIGDVTGDGYGDLAIGTPAEDNWHVNSGAGSGAVTLLKGSAAGVTVAGATQVKAGPLGAGDKPGNRYFALGSTLVVVDVNRDGRAEVVAGAPASYDPYKNVYVGAVLSFVGRSTGLSATGVQIITQDTPGVPNTAGNFEYFGDSLAAGDVTGDGYADLVVGCKSEWVGSRRNAGAVYLVPGSASRFTGAGTAVYSQDTPSVADTAEQNDTFGYSVAVLNRDGDAKLDVLVGTPGEKIADEYIGRGRLTMLSLVTGTGVGRLTQTGDWTGAQMVAPLPAPWVGFTSFGTATTGSRGVGMGISYE